MVTCGHHTCAIKNNAVRCFGYNDRGQLGIDVSIQKVPGDAADLGDGFVPNSVHCGFQHTCVVSTAKTMKCFGDNYWGQLGYENTDQAPRGAIPEEVELPSGFLVSEVVGGYDATCVLSTTSDVLCFGRNRFGQLGIESKDIIAIGDDENEMGDFLKYTDLGDFQAAKLIAGAYSFCALSVDGKVKCWGYNKYGQLGLGHTTHWGDNEGSMGDNLETLDLGTNFVVASLDCGHVHCCALSFDNVFKCWGHGDSGRIGRGNVDNWGGKQGQMGDNLASVSLGAGFIVREFMTKEKSTCTISTDGRIKCFGDNEDGELFVGDRIDRGDNPDEMGDHLPFANVGTGFDMSATHVVGGGHSGSHFCLLQDSGDLLAKCWGYDTSGQCGIGQKLGGRVGERSSHLGDNLPFIDFGTWPDSMTTPPPLCDAADMVAVNWHDMLNEDVQSPSLLHSESVAFEASTLSLTFSASLEYVGKAADGNFDNNFNLGTTYWIDFQSFASVDGGIDSAGSCTNRRSADYSGLSFAEMWEYPVDPTKLDSVNTAERMAYPPSDWTLSASDCTTIQYERTLNWAALTQCQDAAGKKLISVEDTSEALKLSGTFFVELVSPYSMATEGYFRTFPVVQQGFEIVLNKQVDVMASTGVQLFISSVMAYARNDEDGIYEVTVLIQSADYVRFDLTGTESVTAPPGITVSGVESFVGDCLVSSSFTCGQIFTAKIAASCPDDGSVDLSGSYQFAFTPQCRFLADGTTTDPACDTFMTTLDDSSGKVALGVEVDFVDQCDVNLFDVSFEGTLSFYSDAQFAAAVDSNSDPFVIGQDTIFGKVTVAMADPAISFQLSGVTIESVYVCTAAAGADLSVDSVTGLGGCLSANIDADGPYNVIGEGAVSDYQGTPISTTAANEARFSFLTFDTPRTDIHIHVQALLDVTFATGRRRRVRMLLQTEEEEEGEANQFRSFVGTASVQQDEDGQSAARDDLVGTDGAASGSVGFVVAMIVFTAAMMG